VVEVFRLGDEMEGIENLAKQARFRRSNIHQEVVSIRRRMVTSVVGEAIDGLPHSVIDGWSARQVIVLSIMVRARGLTAHQAEARQREVSTVIAHHQALQSLLPTLPEDIGPSPFVAGVIVHGSATIGLAAWRGSGPTRDPGSSGWIRVDNCPTYPNCLARLFRPHR